MHRRSRYAAILCIVLISLVLAFGRFRFVMNDLAGKFGQMPLSHWLGDVAFRAIVVSIFAWFVGFPAIPVFG